ncbi:ankyrin repeat domain-containing protein [Pedobacter sp. MC2016-14]|uniref:ankyrin repeat domain-containing protein n=1 Tax=Pedobacter sp. MC2016-14 TaxID=2897327 RepID=UPI001E5A9D4A|nr:ankyrin repeat domain-containing protein [Pedobacter sp. MC2016-14]
MKNRHLISLIFLLVTGFSLSSCENRVKKNISIERQKPSVVAPVINKPAFPKLYIPTRELTDEFYEAIFANDTKKVIEMLKSTFPPNYEPKTKITPLQAVIRTADNITLAKLMVDGGATINDKEDDLILDAAEYGRLEIMKYLIKKGVAYKHNGSFNKAGFYKFYDGAKYLLLKGADQHVGDISGKLWVFHEAVRKSDYEVLNALKLTKDDLDFNECNGETALIIAIKNNNMAMVQYLIKKDVDKQKPETFDCGDDTYYGKLPIEIAKANHFEEIVDALK